MAAVDITLNCGGASLPRRPEKLVDSLSTSFSGRRGNDAPPQFNVMSSRHRAAFFIGVTTMSNKHSNSIRDRHLVILKRLRDEIFEELPAAERKRIEQAKQARAEERSFREEMRRANVQSRLW